MDPVIQTLIQNSLHLAGMGDYSSSNMACLSGDREAFQGCWKTVTHILSGHSPPAGPLVLCNTLNKMQRHKGIWRAQEEAREPMSLCTVSQPTNRELDITSPLRLCEQRLKICWLLPIQSSFTSFSTHRGLVPGSPRHQQGSSKFHI